MRKYISFLYLVFSAGTADSQAIMSYYDGRPAFEKKLTNVEGNELLYPDWITGQVTTRDGRIYKGQKLKYNQLEDQFYFQNADGLSMQFTTPLKEIMLGDSSVQKIRVFRNGFPAVYRFTSNNYYEVIADGKNMLLKKTVKSVNETREFNSPVVKNVILDNLHYYFYNGIELFAVKKDKTVFLGGEKEKAAAIETFISSGKINFRKEEDLIKLVQYINTLNQQK